MTYFALSQALLANRNIKTQMPISGSPEGRVTEMLKYIFFNGDEGQVLWAKDSYFSRTQVPTLPFLLHALKTKNLHSPAVPPGFLSGPISGALTMIRAKQDTRGSRICPSTSHLQGTEILGVTETRLGANLDPLSPACFEKPSVIVQLFLLQATVFACLWRFAPQGASQNSHLAKVGDLGMLKGGETNEYEVCHSDFQ